MSSVPKEVLDGFWRLSEAKEQVRLDAAAKIVEAAQVRQRLRLINRNVSRDI